MSEIKFTKYRKHGAYHWRQYVRGTKYREHVDFITDWVRENNLLDVGAGDGLITYLLRATGIDNEPDAIRIAKALNVDVSLGDAYNLDFADDSFDAVLMIDVIEHFATPKIALREARRVAPVIYIATPERQPEKPVRDKYHVQEWTRNELVEFMRSNHYYLTEPMHFVEEGATMYGRFERIVSDTE